MNKQKSKKTLISTILRLLLDFFFFEDWCKCTLKKCGIQQKNFLKNLFFVRIWADPRVLMTKNNIKNTAENLKKIFFWLIPRSSQRTSKLQEKLSAFKGEHPALQMMKFNTGVTVFYISCPFLASWIRTRIENPDLDPWTQSIPIDPQHCKNYLFFS